MGVTQSKENNVRIISLNMQMSTDKKWIDIFRNMTKGVSNYILCLQEVEKDTLVMLTKYLPIKVHYYDKENNICVFISSSYQLPTDIMVDSVHLNDIPAPLHLLKKVYYEGHTSKDYLLPYNQIKDWSAKSRLPDINKCLKKHMGSKRSIIAGDFNEPRGWPVSDRMKQFGYIDLGESVDKYTWPVYPFYQGEPSQRIDFIYAKGIELIRSSQYYEKDWLSDHLAVISDVRL